MNQVKLIKISCPHCESADYTIEAEGVDFLHGKPGVFFASSCNKCGLWYQNPRPTESSIPYLYPSDYLPHTADNKEKEKFFHPFNARKYLAKKLNYKFSSIQLSEKISAKSLAVFDNPFTSFILKWVMGVLLIPKFIENGKLLELGCASGQRLQIYKKIGWKNLFGVELSETAAQSAREKGFNVACDKIENALNIFPNEHFDVIVTAMVLEHLVNPFETMSLLNKKLKPGGQLLFSTITRDSYDFGYYGNYWGGFDFPRHLVYFSKKEIVEMLGNSFEKPTLYYHFAPQDFLRSSTWKLQHGKEKKLFDKFIVKNSLFRSIVNMYFVIKKKATRVSVITRKHDATA